MKKIGVLGLSAKPEDPRILEKYCLRRRRSSDLVVFGSEPWHCFNFVDFSVRVFGFAGANQVIADVFDAMNPQKKQGGDEFWIQSSHEGMGHSAVACFLANGHVTPRDMAEWLAELPCSMTERYSEEWQKSKVARSFVAARARGHGGNLDLLNAESYALNFWPRMDAKLSGSIQAEIRTFLSKFLAANVAGMVNGRSTITPFDLDRYGLVLVVGTPTQSHGAAGRLINLAWKICTYYYLLARKVTPDSRYIAVVTDEAAQFACARVDALVQSSARSARCLNIMAVQNIPLLQTFVGGNDAAAEVKGWLGNYQCVIACQNPDRVTCEYVSKLIGDSTQLRLSGSTGSPRFDLGKHLLGLSQEGGGGSWSEDIRPQVPPEDIANKLRKGGIGFVETIIHRGGTLLPNGKTWMRYVFSQG